MTLQRLLTATTLGLLCTLAGAQQMWEWSVEENGTTKRYLSDRPPPANLRNVKILRSPGGNAAARAAQSAQGPVAVPALAASDAAAPVPQEIQANVPTPSTEDKDLMARKKQAEAAEAAKVRAAQQADAAARAKNCTRAQAGKATFDSGQRIATTSASGERTILDDDARAAELRRIQALINANCR